MKKITVLAGIAVCASALGTDFNEVEPNDNKSFALANGAFTMSPGDALVGTSTGSSTVTPGGISCDNYLVKSAAVALGIYQYRLAITTTGTAGHTGFIRGLTQTSGVINATPDFALQTSSASSSPARFVQWYGFGMQEQLYYRVTGVAGTTSAYRATLTRIPVTPIDCGTFKSGSIRLSTIGQGHATDTDMWVYDSGFNAMPGLGDDDTNPTLNGGVPSSQSTVVATLGAGTYYVAISNWNLANDQPSPASDNFRDGEVLDFPNAVLCASVSSPFNCAFAITDSDGPHAFAATKTGPYDVVFAKFTVVAPPPVEIETDSFTLSPGQTISGGVSDLDGSNDAYWVLRPGLIFSISQDPVRLELVGHAPGTTATSLAAIVESRSSAGGVQQRIEAYDYTTAAYVTLNTGILPFGANPDGVLNLPLDPAKHINPSSTPANEMKLRLSYRATIAVFAYPWKPSLDDVHWVYQPF